MQVTALLAWRATGMLDAAMDIAVKRTVANLKSIFSYILEENSELSERL